MTAMTAKTLSPSEDSMSKNKIRDYLKDGSGESLAERKARVERIVAEASAVLTPDSHVVEQARCSRVK
ncbi:hypothetical protein PG996_003241 [Apiospora saccharicola]|uniref:Uncharacterized protein n=1 Tax=Apiospora saccharicola TaxID=335842 RepID=A0ABR1W0Q4_9PEZI